MNVAPPDAPPTLLGRLPICSSAHLEGRKKNFFCASVCWQVRRRHYSSSVPWLAGNVRRPVELGDVAHDPRSKMVKPLVD